MFCCDTRYLFFWAISGIFFWIIGSVLWSSSELVAKTWHFGNLLPFYGYPPVHDFAVHVVTTITTILLSSLSSTSSFSPLYHQLMIKIYKSLPDLFPIITFYSSPRVHDRFGSCVTPFVLVIILKELNEIFHLFYNHFACQVQGFLFGPFWFVLQRTTKLHCKMCCLYSTVTL